MNKKKWVNFFLFLIITLVFFVMVGCWDKGELNSETAFFELEKAQKVDATIAIYKGNLYLYGINQSQLLMFYYTSNLTEWNFQIDYEVENELGKLKIIQKKEKSFLKSFINNCSLLFNSAIPLSLDVIMGSGENHLDFSSINLTDLKVAIGTGDTIIDLTGNYSDNINVYLVGGFGHTTINLAQEVGVGIWINGGLNKINCNGFNRINNYYYNSAFYSAEKKIFLTVITGIGFIDINLI